MSQLGEFVRKRAIDNLVTGTIAAIYPDPLLFDVKMPDGRVLTLLAAELINVGPGDPVGVAVPSGDRKRAYISGPAAVLVAGDPTNRVLALGQG